MKNLVKIMMILSIILSLFGCSSNKYNLPKYDKKECFYSNGFQDYTDYCKFYYNFETIKQFESDKRFAKVKDSDIIKLKSFLEDFNENVINQSYYSKYDFDYNTQIKEGDYFCVVTRDNEDSNNISYNTFDSYEVYYVDMEKNILYFFHSNT